MKKARLELDERVAHVWLAAPKANILDFTMVSQLDDIFEQLQTLKSLRAIVIEGEGPNFSYGASVEEHLPDHIEGALGLLSGLLRRMAAVPAPTVAAVRGLCLGGGLEVALACDLIVAEENAQLGVPEIKLGVFPPAASALLPVRIGAAAAASMILTGQTWTAAQALQRGLVAHIGSASDFVAEHLLPRSPTALRYAARAVRASVVRALHEDLPKLDRMYVDELMEEPNADAGIRAFLEKKAVTV
jgi:cyclohexa-1,5-dienecarbonyl-CoA hydratase